MNTKLVTKSFDEIKRDLSSHVRNKFTFREDQIRAYHGITFNNEDWSSKNMRRIYFSDCNFLNVNFKSTGFTGSIFYNCLFTKSNLDCAIYDECLFVNCTFMDMELHSASFCKAEFVDTKFSELILEACFFTGSVFNGTEIANCKIIDIIWENAVFNKCEFSNTILEKLNFEFTYFNDIHFNNTKLPFASLPFVFGGIKYIMNTNDNVSIKTVNPSYRDKKMSKDEYVLLLPELITFYRKTQNYFPLANLLLSFDDTIEGIKAIQEGLKFWFNIRNYKIMYYLCELANIYDFSIENRKIVYESIKNCDKWIHENESTESQKRWHEYYQKIRDCLINSKSVPYVELEIATLIEHNDYEKVSAFMQVMDKLISARNCYFSLELRHNSPFEFLYKIFSDPNTLISFVSCLVTTLGVCNQIYSNHVNNKKNTNNQFTAEDIAKINESISPNIKIISYNFYNCDIKQLDSEDYLTKQRTGCEKPDSFGSNQ